MNSFWKACSKKRHEEIEEMLSTNVKKKRYKLPLKASSSLLRKQFTYRLSLPRSERNIYHQKQRVDLYAMAFTDAGCRLEALHPQEISLVDDLSTRAYIFCWFLLAKLEPRFGRSRELGSWGAIYKFVALRHAAPFWQQVYIFRRLEPYC